MPTDPHKPLPKLFRTSSLRASVATILAYGPGGAGKTFSIRKLKEHGLTPIVIACELGQTHGLLSLQADDIPYIVVETHEEIVDVVRELRSGPPGQATYEGQAFHAVVVDSVTQWGEFPLDAYIALKGWGDLSTPSSRGDGTGKDPRLAYGYLSEKGRQLYKELFAIDAHLYMIAREGRFGDGSVTDPYFAAPELPGQKLPRELPGWPDATVRLRVINGRHMMVTQGEGGSPARVRLPADLSLPLRCNPDIGALAKLMCGDRSMLPLLTPAPEVVPAMAKKAKGLSFAAEPVVK